LRERQLQCSRELNQAKRLEKMCTGLDTPGLIVGRLMDAGANDGETRALVPKAESRLERLAVRRLDQDDVRFCHAAAVEERRVVTEAPHDRRVQAPNVFVGFEDEKEGHGHVLVDPRMFSRVCSV
jgi:hypothetical protein